MRDPVCILLSFVASFVAVHFLSKLVEFWNRQQPDMGLLTLIRCGIEVSLLVAAFLIFLPISFFIIKKLLKKYNVLPE